MKGKGPKRNKSVEACLHREKANGQMNAAFSLGGKRVFDSKAPSTTKGANVKP